jgi:hypothetical protein
MEMKTSPWEAFTPEEQLQITQNPAKAVAHFRAAFNANQNDRRALIGLLSALVRNEAYTDITALSHQVKPGEHALDRVVAALIALSKTLHWLDSQTMAGFPPDTTQGLERFNGLDLHKYAGSVVDSVVGRLHLLEGNAARAAEILLPLAEKHPGRWSYYATWAAILTSNRNAVERIYTATSQWSGKWTIACLLMDVDPALAEKRQLYSFLGMAAKNPEMRAYAHIIEARIALARSSLPSAVTWTTSAANLEENLEALRTHLGCAFYRRSGEVMARSMAQPLFRLLPLADRLMWRGLHTLLAGDQVPGRALLEDAAIKFGYQRASLALAVYFLEQKKISEAKQFLERAAGGRTDAKIGLLRAYIDACEGRTERAITQAVGNIAANPMSHNLLKQGSIATSRLLTHLFQAGGGADITPGRYHLLEQVIERSPKLLQALLDNNAGVIQREWTLTLKQYQTDVRFLHLLAVAYWECALTSLTSQKDAERYWLFSTALWALLLSSSAFWHYFSEARYTPIKGEERQTLTTEQMDNLLRNALGDMFVLHWTEGSRNFEKSLHAPDRQTQEWLRGRARVHLQCINLCCADEQAVIAVLNGYGISWSLRIDKGKLEMVANQARKVLDRWCAMLVEEADIATKDSESMKHLPKGVRIAYQEGISRLTAYIQLNVPVIRVLITCLDWYNDWCYDLYLLGDIARIKELMQSVRSVAEQLIPLSVKSQDHRQENRALSQHFLFRGFITDDPRAAIKEFEEAISWDSTNSNAKKLLEDSKEAILSNPHGFEIKQAMEENDFSRAERLLRDALANETRVERRQEIQKQLSLALNNHGVSLAHELQESEKQLSDAFTEIADSVRQALPNAHSRSNIGFDDPTCPICKTGRVEQKGLGESRGRGNVIAEVIKEVQSRGSLEISGSINFWLRFQDDLCSACRYKPARIVAQKREALKLLEEATDLDPSNESARKNLASVRGML